MTGKGKPQQLGNGNDGGVNGNGEVTEQLTPLGVLVAQLPVDPRIAKMMLFGAVFQASPFLLFWEGISNVNCHL